MGFVVNSGWLSQHQPAAFGLRNRVAELFGHVNPQLDRFFDVGEGAFVAIPMGHATRKLGHFGDEDLVLPTAVKDDFVFRHQVINCHYVGLTDRESTDHQGY